MSPKLKAAIIQENTLNIGILRHYLTVVNPEIVICGAAESIDQAVCLIEEHQPDIIFLDTHLKDGLSFQVADIILEKGRLLGELVFLSSNERCDYALKAVEYACLDYILKPITESTIRRATEKAKERCLQKMLLEHVLKQKQQSLPKTTIVPTKQNGNEAIDFTKVSYFEAQKQNTTIHFSDGSVRLVSQNLGYFKKQLLNGSHFFQIHHARLVNIRYIKSFNSKSHKVVMVSGEVLEASRRYSLEFKDLWIEFSKHHFFI